MKNLFLLLAFSLMGVVGYAQSESEPNGSRTSEREPAGAGAAIRQVILRPNTIGKEQPIIYKESDKIIYTESEKAAIREIENTKIKSTPVIKTKPRKKEPEYRAEPAGSRR